MTEEKNIKVKLYGEKEEEPKEVLRLRTTETSEGGLLIFAVDKDGEPINRGKICKFTVNGTLERCQDIGSGVPIQKDDRGRIVVI